MSDAPLVTVIMPAYNAARTISRAVKSVLRQTADLELIIVDDCSTDDTRRKTSRMARRHPEIVVLENERNVGSGPSRNRAIAQAKGRFIAFLDADDVYPDRTSLEKMCNLAIEKDVHICGSLRESRIGRRTVKEKLFRSEALAHPDGFVKEFREEQWEYDFNSYVYEREFLVSKSIQFPDLRRYQDVPFLVECMAKAERFAVCPVEGYRYTFVPGREYSEKEKEDILIGVRMVIEICKEYEFDILIKRTKKRCESEYPFIENK